MLSIIQTAETYELTKLKYKSLDFLLKCVNQDSVVDLMIDARGGKFKFNTDALLEKCIEILEDRAGDLLTGKELFKLDEKMLLEIIKSNKIAVEEIEIFHAVIKWGKNKLKKNENLYDILRQFMRHIRFPLMTIDELIDVVKPTNLISEEEYICGLEYGIIKLKLSCY
jgi:hypothetical protein